jgi:predicted nucleotidyltransferase
MEVFIEKVKLFLAAKEERRKHFLDVKYESALGDFNAIKQMIAEHYCPKRIYQWGSLLDRSLFREYSDIDIAVEGVDDPERFSQMFGEAEKLTKFPLDLLDINKIATEFSDIIKVKGRLVYERRD